MFCIIFSILVMKAYCTVESQRKWIFKNLSYLSSARLFKACARAKELLAALIVKLPASNIIIRRSWLSDARGGP